MVFFNRDYVKNMSTILVTGASGFIGQQLVKALQNSGERVIGVSRKEIYTEADVSVLMSEFCGENVWQKPLQGCDVVVHLAARVHVMADKDENSLAEFRRVNVEGTLNLANQAAQAGIKRFVFISSIKVNGESTRAGEPFTEMHVACPQDEYGVSKLEAEEGLLNIANNTKMEVVIIRPPLVYGAGVKANLSNLITVIKKGIPLPLGAINNARSLVYLGNLVDFIVLCCHHAKAANQTFLISDDDDVSTTKLIKVICVCLGKRTRLLPVPKGFLVSLLTLAGKKELAAKLCSNLQVDISKAKNMLGWKPRFSFVQGIEQTMKSTLKG